MPIQVKTKAVRLSYLHVFEPQAAHGGDPKYSVSLIIPKSDKALVKMLRDAEEAAIQEGMAAGGKFNGKRPKKSDSPLRDGDEKGDEVYADSYYISAKSHAKKKPKLFDINNEPLEDPEELYSGCYGRAIINFYAYNVNGSAGIAVGLEGIKKIRDGERLGGSTVTAAAFGDDDEDEFEG